MPQNGSDRRNGHPCEERSGAGNLPAAKIQNRFDAEGHAQRCLSARAGGQHPGDSGGDRDCCQNCLLIESGLTTGRVLVCRSKVTSLPIFGQASLVHERCSQRQPAVAPWRRAYPAYSQRYSEINPIACPENTDDGTSLRTPAAEAKCSSVQAEGVLLLRTDDQATLVEQVKRVKEIEAIESDSFVPQTFRSSKEVKKSIEPTELQYEPVTVGAATVDTSAPEKEPPPANIPTAIKYQDDNSLAHPNLFIEKAEAEEKWFQRLVALRQERLMGSPVA
nr:PREDICTED: serine/Arginine-related protein 53 [Opisthocomus hoazin]